MNAPLFGPRDPSHSSTPAKWATHSSQISSLASTLQMHCPKNLKHIFPEMKLGCSQFLISTFMYLWAMHQSANAIQQNRRNRPWEYIYRSQIHKCRNWERGRAVSFLGIFVSNFRYSALYHIKKTSCLFPCNLSYKIFYLFINIFPIFIVEVLSCHLPRPYSLSFLYEMLWQHRTIINELV